MRWRAATIIDDLVAADDDLVPGMVARTLSGVAASRSRAPVGRRRWTDLALVVTCGALQLEQLEIQPLLVRGDGDDEVIEEPGQSQEAEGRHPRMAEPHRRVPAVRLLANPNL